MMADRFELLDRGRNPSLSLLPQLHVGETGVGELRFEGVNCLRGKLN
jgi:hypothetical protein